MASSRKVLELFVSRVPWTVQAKEMREYFTQFGAVKKCLLPFDKETGFHRGFCWVSFSSEEGISNALQKDPHVLEGSKLQVQRNRRPFSGQKSSRDVDSD
ncbi:SRA stem-loop-interacting RNA-binding protein, mitochondrial [Cololabis saira]|uniref:SRA stem-loop-interacting RNA-binding protein, mitochondrial n=1 Tax=Cololabis saira TaxID=129043 RepID=UPI002AD41E03|nr:SRA stem-loop-interacting RNA-binding protein, mitochondrial [Cololabis saira]